MKEIPLTQGQSAIVDDWWYDYLMQWEWCALWSETSGSFYAVRNEMKSGKRISVRMHRVVAKTPDDMQCDHIYHDTLDNRERKLRNVTQSQSNMNKRNQKNNKTGIVGITVRRIPGTYRATLVLDGRYVLDKTFKTIEKAIVARREAEMKYFGEFAYHEEVS